MPTMSLIVIFRKPNMVEIIRMLRLNHWVKNVFLVAGFFMAELILEVPNNSSFTFSIILLVTGLFFFGLASSSNYVINEYFDRRTDAFHPIKKHRHKDSHLVTSKITLLLWSILASLSIIGSTLLSLTTGVLCTIFIVCGVLYNIPPFRFKDKAYLDIYWESLNSPLRILYGWCLLSPNTIPPISLLFGFHTLGAFLMSAKRLSEYRLLSDSNEIQDKSRYRKSMEIYTLGKLQFLVSANSSMAILMFTVFVVKYNQQSILVLIFLILGIALYSKKMVDSVEEVTESPHKIYMNSQSLWLLFVSIFLWVAYMNLNVDMFDWIFDTSQLQFQQILRDLKSILS